MIQSPFRFPGAKNKLIPILMEHLNPLLKTSSIYCEPFIGGGSVALEVAKQYPSIKIYLNDKDPWISSFWSIVASSDTTKLDRLLSLLDHIPTIETFYRLAGTSPTNDLERAHYAIFFNRTCFSGIVKRNDLNHVTSNPIGGREQKSQYHVFCRYNSKKLKEKILQCHKLLVGRTIVDNEDVNDYLSKLDKDTILYLDPPYYVKASILYNKYMQHQEHVNLANALDNRNSWVLSYDDTIEIRSLYKNKQIIDLSCNYSINGSKKNWSKKNELIILPN